VGWRHAFGDAVENRHIADWPAPQHVEELSELTVGGQMANCDQPSSPAATRVLIGNNVDEGKVWIKGQAAAAQAYIKVRERKYAAGPWRSRT
jgi:hypothetical protein